MGLAHSYSRAKVKFNVNRVDNMVIQAIFLLDTLDKDVNSFSMRVRLATCFLLPVNTLCCVHYMLVDSMLGTSTSIMMFLEVV